MAKPWAAKSRPKSSKAGSSFGRRSDRLADQLPCLRAEGLSGVEGVLLARQSR